MGREIRRVPKGWQHPRDEHGHYKPLHDEPYEAAAKEWVLNFMAWEDGTHKWAKEKKARCPFYWDWNGNPPDKDYYRPAWTEEPMCFQVYETVSEGTPASPVFETKDEMLKWLLAQGHSETSARDFVEGGWCPSMVVTGGRIYGPGIEAMDGLRAGKQDKTT